MRSGEVEKWRSGEWQNGEVARALPICMVLTLISISRRIDSDDSIGVKLLLYSSVCCRVYQYSEAGSNAFGGVVALWLFVQKSMKKARKKLKVKRVEAQLHVLCVGVFIRPRICQANLVLRVGGEVLQHI